MDRHKGASLDALMKQLGEDPHREKAGGYTMRRDTVDAGDLVAKLTARVKASRGSQEEGPTDGQ